MIAAWRYISQQDNASKYSRPDLEHVRANIARAAKKFGVEMHDESGSKAGASTLTGTEAENEIVRLTLAHPGFLRA